jgi:PAS domain S-box-containing protein
MCVAISAIPVGIIGGIQGFKYTSMMLIALIFLVTFIVSITISYLITRPIEKLTSNINHLSKGKLDVNLSSSELYEIDNLINSLNRIMASLKLAIHKVGVKKGEIFQDSVKTKEETEKKQKDIIKSIKGWAWEINTKGIFTYCSDNITNYLGYEKNEVIGKSIFDLVSTEDVKKLKNLFNESTKKKEPILNFENCVMHKNGKLVCVLTNCYPIYDNCENFIGFRGVHNDITNERIKRLEVKKLNLELDSIKTEMSGLINKCEQEKPEKNSLLHKSQSNIYDKWEETDLDSIVFFDDNANVLDCNNAITERLGYSKDEMLSLNLCDFDALESKEEILNKIKITKKNGSYTFKTIYKKRDGSSILVFENLQYIRDENRYKAIIREDNSNIKT